MNQETQDKETTSREPSEPQSFASSTCSLPDWDSISKKIDNGVKLTALERFIYQYDDADKNRSIRFFLMLSEVLKENRQI